MMKLAMITLFLLPITLFASGTDLVGRKILVQYDDGAKYQIEFQQDHLTWTGVEGVDEGRSETDAYSVKKIDSTKFFVQWTELDGTFVVIVVDLSKQRVLSSGQFQDYTWFREGKIL